MRAAWEESSLLFRLERGPGIALQAMQEKKALSSRGCGARGGFLPRHDEDLREPLVRRHTPVFLPGDSQGQGSLVGCRLWGRKESDTTEQLSTAHLQNTQPLPTTVIGTCWTLSHRCLSPGPLLSPHKSPPFALVSVLSRAAKGTLFKLKLDHVSSLPRTSRAVLS